MKKLSVYIHIPFCLQKCIYCNFVSFPGKNEMIEEYFKSLETEIVSVHEKYKNYEINTIFIGGGTPSAVDSKYIKKTVETLKKYYNISQKCEFSIECNPKTLTNAKVRDYIEIGVNRFSMGLQTANDKLLKMLNRPHNKKDFEDAVNILKRNGVKNFNIDILLGIPNQSFKVLKDTLEFVVSKKPTHISAYGLIYEEGTPLYDKVESGELKMLSDSKCVKYYDYTLDFLKENGYSRYEVSNFSKVKYNCKHNIAYWTDKDYIGFGLSAHSKIGDNRFSNTSGIEEYIKNPTEYSDSYILTKIEKYSERIMLGLRMDKGISIKKLNKEFCIDFEKNKQKELKFLKNNHFIKIEDDYIKVTDKGFKVLNCIIEKLT